MIRIRGAREHNLVGVDLDLPSSGLTVVVGRSGSGKSSLVFDTLHAEAQRRYLEAAAASGQKPWRRPHVDLVEGLPPSVAVGQRARRPGASQRLVDALGLGSLLRVLQARAGVQHCPQCDRPVEVTTHDEAVAAVLERGGRVEVDAPVRRLGTADVSSFLEEVAGAGFSRVRVDGAVRRIEEIAPRSIGERVSIVVDRIRVSADKRSRLQDAVRTAARVGRGVFEVHFESEVLAFVDRPRCVSCDLDLPSPEPEVFRSRAPYACASCEGRGTGDAGAACAVCSGTGLCEAALAIRLEGRGWAEWMRAPASELVGLLESWPATHLLAPVVQELRRRAEVLAPLGLAELPLGRRVGAISSGELQRVVLARHVGGALVGVLHIFDEPTAHLDAEHVQAVCAVLSQLAERGNAVLVVEHHPAVLALADHVVELGPGAGAEGGQLVFSGPAAAWRSGDTVCARWFDGRMNLPGSEPREPSRRVGPERWGAGIAMALAGANGAGKTRLIERVVASVRESGDFARVVVADQGQLPRSSRSNPATWTGLWNLARTLLAATPEAKIRGFSPSHFSLQARGGRCEACGGQGTQRISIKPLPDVYRPCPVCEGRRFAADVLDVTWRGLSAADMLDRSASELLPILAGHPGMERYLRALVQVGLGYVAIGQAAHTLSGGEAQRLKLARELARVTSLGGEDTLVVLDDPTVGLHDADTALLLDLLDRMVEAGSTVWLATHHPGLLAWADEVVDLGP